MPTGPVDPQRRLRRYVLIEEVFLAVNLGFVVWNIIGFQLWYVAAMNGFAVGFLAITIRHFRRRIAFLDELDRLHRMEANRRAWRFN